ncbi:MAG TPA: cytochrome c oxidase subunit 3 [Gaiellaceae bacterium]|jgi:heme/copper-type cytochrome/quinol oxidase subunit 3|nr:cytochrome c oxidase subunit 3 [Gaiellaceae bacterium]
MEHAYALRRRRPPQPVAHPNGWWGMAIFVASEATLFGALLGTYYYLRFKAVHWPPAGVPEPKALVPLILTAVLVSSSVPMQLALRAARAGRATGAQLALLAALGLQGLYFGLQVHLFLSDLAKFSPSDSAYGSIYFTLVGAHHAHVAVGLLLSLWFLLRLSTGITTYRLTGLWAATFYWHFVNALAVLVVLTQLSPAL